MPKKSIAAIPQRIRIFILEEQELFREGLCMLLSKQCDFEVVGHAGSWDKAFPVIQREQPDIVVIAAGPEDGIRMDLLSEIASVSESTRILMLSKSKDSEFHRQAVRLGAAGVLAKDTPSGMLIKAIERVHAGEAWLDRFTTASLLRELSPRNRIAKQSPDEMKIATLTEREREVIQLIGKGLKNKQIAEALFISDITVHHHLTAIYSKLDVADRFELLIYSYRNGLAEIPR